MKNYRRKANGGVIVEAEQLGEFNVDRLANWAGGQVVEERDALNHEAFEALNIKTPHGRKRVSRGMWIVKWEDSFFVATDSFFKNQYEAAQ